jgi:carboxynorspermidine decarboxylase
MGRSFTGKEGRDTLNMDLKNIDTPCYVIDEQALERNLSTLTGVQERAGCKILLALKGFACFSFFPLIRKYLRGVSASSLHEARLGREEFGKEVHVCAPAYAEHEFKELLEYADHVVFNSFAQWRKFKPHVTQQGNCECGIRINPEHSEVRTAIYDPCKRYSRLGVTASEFKPDDLEGISGLHFHCLCEMNADSLERTLAVVEEKFGSFIDQMKWVNFGGGHHITREDYYRDSLCRLIIRFKERHRNVEVYLEPGEAIALNTGVLVASVLDLVHNEKDIAILDASASAHMPDVLEMPYRPKIIGAGEPGEFKHTYCLGGPTCLAGDIIGDYSFREPLEVGAKVVFLDMAHYTIVKNTTFNGVRLPSIAALDKSGKVRVVRRFDYDDFKTRLG